MHQYLYGIQELSAELTAAAGGDGRVVPIRCDLTKEEEILAMFEQIKKELGGVDILVNNAGLAHNEPLLSGSTSQWREMVEVCMYGVCRGGLRNTVA